MSEFQSFEVEDHKGIVYQYEMLHLPVPTSLKILTRLTKLVSDPMGKAVGAFKGSDKKGMDNILDGKIDFDMIGQAITSLGDRLDEEMVWDTLKTLLSTVKVENDQGGFTKVNVDTHFAGKPGLLLKVVFNSVKVNYEDFLGPALDGLENVKQLLPQMSRDSSTGTNGDQYSKGSQQEQKSKKSGT